MSDSSPLPRHESDARRSLQDRFVDVFRSDSSSMLSSGYASGHNGNQGLGITHSESDVRTRLLESYDRSDPACGERRCSHGTFSPRPEGAERQIYLENPRSQLGYTGVEDTGAASSHFHGGDEPAGSRPDSEYMSQMKSSQSALSKNEHKKLYAENPSPSSASTVVARLWPKETNRYLQIHFLLHPILQLDQAVSLVFRSRRFDSCADGLLHLHPNGLVVGI